MTREIKHTNCHYCGYLCALDATVEEGRVVDIAPDTTRYPYDERIVRQCRRWRMNLDDLDGADRLNYPLRRAGARGSGQWERVSWDEALDDIAARLEGLVKEHGARTVASAIGGPHATYWPLHRFMNLLGSPNNMGIGQICWNPRVWMDTVTFGWTIEADIDPRCTQTLVLWGTNPAQSDNSAFWRSVVRAAKDGMDLVVVDPRRTQAASLARVWLPIRPGTDCALALGLVHAVIENGWCDWEFVRAWCHGFDELAETARPYTPQATAAVCGVPADDVVEAARLFACASASALVSGRGVDQSGAEVAPTHRAIAALRAITGNVDKPGSCVIAQASDFTWEVDLEASDALSEEGRAACLNSEVTPLQSFEGCDALARITGKLGRRLPVRYLASAHPSLVWKAVLEGDPYPVRALIVEATNPLLTYADTQLVHRALHALDLLVVLEYRMTPTAALADYVLPAAGAIERPVLQAHGGVANIAYGGDAAVEPYYERRCDYDVFRALGLRLGQAEAWPARTLREAMEGMLADIPLSWQDFCKTGLYAPPPGFFKHERPGPDGTPLGFATATGKIELASEFLPALGGSRVPQGRFAPDARFAALPQTLPDGAVALLLNTGARKQPYNASMYLGRPEFRSCYPRALAEVSRATACLLGAQEGDEVEVRTASGKARFALSIIDMRDDVVSVDYGWWDPDAPLAEPELGNAFAHNANMLTSCSLDEAEPLIGTWSYNAIACTVRRLDR